MYKKIMVAIDDNGISQSALQEALHIAGAYGAKLCIVHTVSNPNDASLLAGAGLLENAQFTAGNTLDVETRLLKADAEYGLSSIAETIANAVDEWGADLLVVGSKGRRGLERLVVGSVAEQLISTIGISIFLVRLD